MLPIAFLVVANNTFLDPVACAADNAVNVFPVRTSIAR